MALAGLWTAADYVQALRRRRELIDELDRAMADLDLVMTARRRAKRRRSTWCRLPIMEQPLLTMPFNVTGSPAMSICCGFAENGLPLSIQLVGKRFDDATVLKVATPTSRRRRGAGGGPASSEDPASAASARCGGGRGSAGTRRNFS